MTAPNILIQPGIPEPLRPRAGELYFDAFEGKLGGILGRDGRGARLMARFMRPAETLSALSPDGATLYGLAGLKTEGRAFMDGTLSDVAGEYGRFGGLWRGLLLTILEEAPEPGCLHIDALAVAAEARGRSVGTRLLAAAREDAVRRGLQGLSLDVVDTNPRARALYERVGFEALRTGSIGPLRHLFGFRASTRMRADLDLL
jgi:ribosomal protein S18 acetylase RimI-like enzyme